MKKIFCIILSILILLSSFIITAFAAEENDISVFEFPKPEAPNYFIYTDGDASEGQHDDLRMIMVADPKVAALAAEYYSDSDAFYEKYGLWSFAISMQYDVSLDDEEHWQHTEEWDNSWYTSGYADGYPYVSLGSEMMEDFEFFWLTYYEGPGSDTFVPYQPAIITDIYHDYGYDREVYSFDTKNHSLYIRCRYYMEWEPVVMGEYGEEPGEKQSKFSDWSESAVFGKNSTQIIPEEPTVYEAPIVSDLKIILPNEIYYDTHLEYIQTTPESVWLANIYYMMTDDGYFDGLETQVSINGGEWIEFDTADAGGDWCLWNGSRHAFNDDVQIDENTNVRLRIRFTGSHGPSPWSNIAEVNEVVGNDIIYGDVDGNKKVNVLDANLIRRYAAKIIGFDSKQLIAGDVDGNGKVNVLDANLVRRHAAKLINSFPVEN
ncbi:MAG: dockerin type I repeat-containing protein [Oscillospiraceae bacterium]|nr:dockerin type I repeat-containing protein [Oscillospiraceae bacterium]